MITRLCLGLSHLHEHKFKHSFQDCLNPLCFCNNDNETSTHYLLHCPTFKNQRMTLLDKTESINGGILELSSAVVKKILLVLHFHSRIIDKELYQPFPFAFLFSYFWNDLVYFSLLILVKTTFKCVNVEKYVYWCIK